MHDGEASAGGYDVGLDTEVRLQEVHDCLMVPCLDGGDDTLGQPPELQQAPASAVQSRTRAANRSFTY